MRIFRPKPYEGTEPYLFVSYAHKDNERILPLIDRLQKDGYRLWYDEGIEAGIEWAKQVAAHLQASACMLAFITKNYMDSQNCLDEIEHAKNQTKPTVIVYLEDLDLPDWFKMRHNRTQAVLRSKYATEDESFQRLYQASILSSCRGQSMPDPAHDRIEIAPAVQPDRDEPATSVQSADQVEDTPSIPETISDSWEEIIASINNGTYASKYHVGDTKAIDLGTEGIVAMEIVAMNTDELADGSGTAAITWISKQLLRTSYRMDVFSNNWKKSEMRSYLKKTIMPLIPEIVRNAIKPVRKYSKSRLFGEEEIETTDDVWIPSCREISSRSRYYGEKIGATYPKAFHNNASRVKHKLNSSASWWWLRSAYSTYTFTGVNTDGSFNGSGASYTGGVTLGFCT